jgi:NitT/TauT family transport system substrate-binding protein
MPRPITEMTRRRVALLVGAGALGASLPRRPAYAADRVRIGLPTKTYWPTIIAETAKRQKLFDKAGVDAELTIYRGGAEAFEALAAGAADLVLDTPALSATGVRKGIGSKVVAVGSLSYLGWQLMVKPDSPITAVEQLAGKKVGITSTGSGSDLLAAWTLQDRKIEFTRVPLGGGGLVPNLRSGNVDAIVLYSPLTFQLLLAKQARTLIDYATAVPPHLNSGWLASDRIIKDNPAAVQNTLNALFGALDYLRAHRATAIALIAEIDEIDPAVAAAEYEHTTLNLPTDGAVHVDAVAKGLEMAKLSGMTDMAPADQIVTTAFTPVPTQ